MAGLSYRETAKRVGLSSGRVQKLVEQGRIQKKDGKIDPASVNAYLTEIGKKPHTPTQEESPLEESPPAPEKEPVKLEPVSTAAADGVRGILREAGIGEEGDGVRVTLTEAQTAKTIVQARLAQLKVQEEKGELVRKEFVAEQRVARVVKGFRRLEWVKTRERNEALDCRVLARASAWAIGVDRWGEGKWQELRDQVEGEQANAEGTVSVPRRRRRRQAVSSYMRR